MKPLTTALKPVKVPILTTLALFALTGLMAFYVPLPSAESQSSAVSKIF